jgi:hypothetical protein
MLGGMPQQPKFREVLDALRAGKSRGDVSPGSGESEFGNPSEGGSSPGGEGLPSRLSFKNYALALSRLRRAGMTPTPSAVAAELAELEKKQHLSEAKEETRVEPIAEPVSRKEADGELLETARREVSLWRGRHAEAVERMAALEVQVEELRVEAVLADSLHDLIKEQKLSLESAGLDAMRAGMKTLVDCRA